LKVLFDEGVPRQLRRLLRRKWMPLLVSTLSAVLDKIQPGDYVELPPPENFP